MLSNRSFPNIYAGEIAIGSKNKEQILQILSKNSWLSRENSDLEVYTYCGKSVSINPVSAGVLSSSESVADAAVKYKKDVSFFVLPIEYFKCLTSSADINKLSSSLNS